MTYDFSKNVLTYSDYSAMMEGKHNILSSPEVLVAILNAKRKEIEQIHKQELYESKDGKWRTYYYDESGIRKRLQASSREALLDKLGEIYGRRESKTTVDDIFKEWVESKYAHNEIRESTYTRYKIDYERFFVKSGMSNRPIGAITESELEDFIKDTIVKEGLTQKGFGNFRILLLGIWKYGKRKKHTDLSIRDAIEEMDIKKKSFVKHDEDLSYEVFADDEMAKIIPYLKNNPDTLNKAILLNFYTGLRAGELVALKKSDFERGRYLIIRRTETNTHGATVEENAKTDAGYREVFLSDEAVEIVESLINDPATKDQEWLFVGTLNHHRIIRETLRKRLNSICKKLEIPHKRFHAIRKTYATGLIDNKVDENIIIKQLGHKDIETTKKFYYLLHQSEEKQAKQLEDAVKWG